MFKMKRGGSCRGMAERRGESGGIPAVDWETAYAEADDWQERQEARMAHAAEIWMPSTLPGWLEVMPGRRRVGGGVGGRVLGVRQ